MRLTLQMDAHRSNCHVSELAGAMNVNIGVATEFGHISKAAAIKSMICNAQFSMQCRDQSGTSRVWLRACSTWILPFCPNHLHLFKAFRCQRMMLCNLKLFHCRILWRRLFHDERPNKLIRVARQNSFHKIVCTASSCHRRTSMVVTDLHLSQDFLLLLWLIALAPQK